MMMNKAIVLFGLVCIVSVLEADAGGMSNLFKSRPNADFEALNELLVESLPNDADAYKNLALVKSSLDKLSGSKAKRAGEIFIAFMEAQQCDENLLKDAKDLFDTNVDLQGSQRVQRMLKWKLESIYKLCGQYIDDKVEETYKSSLQESSVGHFLEVFVLEPHYWMGPIGASLKPEPPQTFKNYIEKRDSQNLVPGNVWWAKKLEVLARGDPKALMKEMKLNENNGSYEPVFNKNHFKYAYKKYLVEPCQQLTASLGDIFNTLYVLSKQRPSFISQRSIAVKQLLFGFKHCEALLKVKPSNVSIYCE